MAVLSRICGQKRPNGQIFKFGLQMASFTESRIKNLSAAGRAIFIKASPSGHFVKAASLNGAGQAQWPLYEANDRFIKANGYFIKANGRFIKPRRPSPMAVL